MSDNQITIDGRQLVFTPGETILEVARKNGIFIPILCHIEGARPTGACRICVVEVEGARNLIPACATPAGANMVVHSHSAKVLEARRTILSLLLQSGNHNCAIAGKDPENWTDFEREVENHDQSRELCPAHSACRLQAYAYRYQVDPGHFVRRPVPYPMEMASPLIVRDFSRCILCGRCVAACNEIQVNNAIAHGFRGARAKIVAMGDDILERSECVFCGECIQACPVAALTEKKSRYQIRPWEAAYVRTTCHYCGVGCQMDLHVKGNTVMRVTGAKGALPNLGRLCVRGRFGYDFLKSPHRLTTPMIREGEGLRRASWDEALDLVAEKIREIKAEHGPQAIAGVASAHLTNEALFLMQKLFRAVIGSNHLACPEAAAGFNNPMGELEEAKAIVLVGNDVTEENPVAGTFIKRAANKGCPLLVIDSRETKIGTFATLRLLVKEGTESVLVNGFINQLLERGREASPEVRQTAAAFPLSLVSETTGLDQDHIKGAMDILDRDEPLMVVYGPRAAASASVLFQLQDLLGNLGRPGGGLNYLGPLNNAQGACDMGLLPGHLPGYARVDDDQASKACGEAWGCTLNTQPGLGLFDLIKHMAGENGGPDERIRFLYCVGENLAVTKPVFPQVMTALESADFLVVQDNLDTETLKYADVVLPAASWAEVEGTYTNCERRVSRVRQAVRAPGEAKPPTWIFTQLAGRLGQAWPEPKSRDIWEKEIIPLVAPLQDITYGRIEEGGIPWPLLEIPSPSNGHGPALFRPAFTDFNTHHRALLEQCEGLLESLPRTGGLGVRASFTDPRRVTEAFLALLEEEVADVKGAKAQIDEVLGAYRGKKGGLIPVLQQVQEILGFLPEPVQNYIAQGLGIPPSDVFGVVTFYSFFTMVPRGRHTIRVCLGTACFVKGSARLLENVSRHLKVDVGETTEDREFSLEVVRCLGACGLAPVMVVDDITHGQVDAKEVVKIVESYRSLSE